MPKIKSLQGWMQSGQYLPPFLRDFHDQKDFFKSLDDCYGLTERAAIAEDLTHPQWAENSHLKGYNWVMSHVLIIDYFLWFMAKHGYTLQKTRQPVEVADIDASLVALKKKRQDAMWKGLEEHLSKSSKEKVDSD